MPLRPSHTPYTRRRFLTASTQTAGMIAGASFLPRPLQATVGARPEPVPSIQDPRMKALALRAIQAAREAGASYADIRLTYTKSRSAINDYPAQEEEYLHAGVRALLNGYWGFAAGTLWHPDEMARLGQEAAHQAKVNALGKPREVQLPPARPVTDGHWETPVKRAGYAVHQQEIRDFLRGLNAQIVNEFRGLSKYGVPTNPGPPSSSVTVLSQDKAFASTDESYYTQRLHWIAGTASCQFPPLKLFGGDDGILGFAGAGWEHFTEAPIIETVRRTLQENLEVAELPSKEVNIGRYDVVFDALSVSRLVSKTIGAATELDRALGYEANSSGTSYLSDPEAMLGQFAVGSPLVTVTANRTEPGGVATTKWDDEGVETSEVPLLQNGVLQNYQTSREGAGWLRATSTRLNRPFQSQGFLAAPTAGDAPLIHTGNLVLQSGDGSATQQDLEAQLGTGITVLNLRPRMDFQCLNGADYGLNGFELKGGKRVARIRGAGMLFRSPELWKSVLALGGATSARRWGLGVDREITKGEPAQYGYQSVTAVPMVVKNVTVINAVQR